MKTIQRALLLLVVAIALNLLLDVTTTDRWWQYSPESCLFAYAGVCGLLGAVLFLSIQDRS